MPKTIVFLIVILLTSCVPNIEPNTADSIDPYQAANEKIFNFNRKFDNVLLKPLAQSYQAITPNFISKCISHAFLNLEEVNTIANDLLQMRLLFALEDTWRLALNSTVGLVGCFDVAKNFDLPRRQQSFGLTARTWGLKSGAYIVIPFIGASSTVNMFGLPMKYYVFDPVRLMNNYQPLIQTLRVIDKRVQLFPLDTAIDNAFDPYILYRDAYYQAQEQKYINLTKRKHH